MCNGSVPARILGFLFWLPDKNLWLHPWEYHLGGVMMMLQEHPANFRQLIQKKITRKKLGLVFKAKKNVNLQNFLQKHFLNSLKSRQEQEQDISSLFPYSL